MKQITLEDWRREAAERFGPDRKDWAFQCPACGNVQSIASVLDHNPDLEGDLGAWIYFACEGRHTPGHGCDWSLGGLLRIHKVEVLSDGEATPAFEFADAPVPSLTTPEPSASSAPLRPTKEEGART